MGKSQLSMNLEYLYPNPAFAGALDPRAKGKHYSAA